MYVSCKILTLTLYAVALLHVPYMALKHYENTNTFNIYSKHKHIIGRFQSKTTIIVAMCNIKRVVRVSTSCRRAFKESPLETAISTQ